MGRSVQPVARWAVITTFLLSLIGLGFSTYLTITHFQKSLLVCSDNSVFNCAVVTTSAQSYFLGMPVAILGLGNFTMMAALNSPWAWRLKDYWIHVTRFVLAVVGMCFVLWLISAELLIIKHFCYYCTVVHVTAFALLIVLSIVSPPQLGWTRSPARESPPL